MENTACHRSAVRITAGLTLPELVIVIAILGVMSAIGSIAGTGFEDAGVREDAETLLSQMVRARSLALSGACSGQDCSRGSAHGIHIEADRFVLFEGATFISRDHRTDVIQARSSTAAITGTGTFVFEAGTGAPRSGGAVRLHGRDKDRDIVVSSSGLVTASVHDHE